MAKKHQQKDDKNNPSGLFVPAGIMIGMGIGFLVNNISAGLFIGLGAGFLGMAISMMVWNKKK